MKVLVIDLSYFVFYRYFALANYFKLSQKRTDFTNILEDSEFLDKYTTLFEKNVLELVKKHLGVKRRGLQENSTLLVLFAKDCCRADIWRNAIHPEYKKNRDHQKHAVPFDGRIFDHVIHKILPNMLNTYSFMKVLASCNAEADDVAAVVCKRLYDLKMKSSDECERLIVVTNDHDYLQLLDVVDGIYNLQGQDLSKKAQAGPSIKNMYMKVLLGDPSDNISGVMSKKEVNKLMVENDPTMLETMVRNRLMGGGIESFEKNKMLISFDNIPTAIRCDVEGQLDTILKDLNTT